MSASPLPDLDGFNVPAAVDRMLGDSALWRQALALFAGHFAGWETAWRSCAGDAAQERRCVHALRSASANVGAEALAVAAARLEGALARSLEGDGAAVDDALRSELLEAYRHAWSAADQLCRNKTGETA